MSSRPRAKLWPRGPNSLEKLRSVSHTFVSTSQKHRSKTSKLIRFSSLHFRGNWGWSRTAVRMWLIHLICSNMQWWVHSFPFLWLQRKVAKLASGLLYYGSLLSNNNTTINPQTLTSSYSSRCFSTCDHAGERLFLPRSAFFSRPRLGLPYVRNFPDFRC